MTTKECLLQALAVGWVDRQETQHLLALGAAPFISLFKHADCIQVLRQAFRTVEQNYSFTIGVIGCWVLMRQPNLRDPRSHCD